MKQRTRTLVFGLAVVAAAAGCHRYRKVDSASVSDIEKLAIVARVTGTVPTVEVARVDRTAASASPSVTPEEADQQLMENLLRQVKKFEIEERLRTNLVKHLPDAPPWSTAMPAVEVSTALQSLLVEDKAKPIDYDALASQGADAVLELTVSDMGIRHRGGVTAFFLKLEGRMHRLDGGTIWSRSLEFDETNGAEPQPVDVAALRNGGYREALQSFLSRVGEKVASELVRE